MARVQFTSKTKYGATKVTFDGITFDSKKEGLYYLKLKDMEKKGEISNLKLQVSYELIPKQIDDVTLPKYKQRVLESACKYVADFVYNDREGKEHVVDTKGVRTPEYIIKRKLMLYTKGITIEEIK